MSNTNKEVYKVERETRNISDVVGYLVDLTDIEGGDKDDSDTDLPEASIKSIDGKQEVFLITESKKLGVTVRDILQDSDGVKMYRKKTDYTGIDDTVYKIKDINNLNIVSDKLPLGELTIKDSKGVRVINTSLEDDILEVEKEAREKEKTAEDIKYKEYKVVYTGISSDTGKPKVLCETLIEAKELLNQNTINNYTE